MCPLEENVAVVADQSRLCRGFFHTACLFTVRRLKWPSFHTDGVLLSYRRSLCQKVNWTHTSDNLAKRLRLAIACLKTIGISGLSVVQCRCLTCRFARLFMTKYCKQIVTRTRVYSMSLLSREDCSFIFLVFNLILTGLRKRKSSKTNLNASPYGILLRENWSVSWIEKFSPALLICK